MGPFLFNLVLCTICLLGHWVFPTGCRALHPRLWVFSAHLCALYPPSARALGISCWVPCFAPSPLGFSAHFCALYPLPTRALGISYWVPRFAPSPLGIFCSSLCSVPSIGSGTGYFLLGAVLCTLASGFFCSFLRSVPSAYSGTGYFLLGAVLCALASGYFLLISVLCTLHQLGHWVFPAGRCALHPRLWVFSAHFCALCPPPAWALGISCWVLCFVPSPLGT